ncbi:MAG: indolepyruvate oxidoreductase subunit beta [Candidatus Palauibacterales bacterium]|jgi:indolepyruvate ferredoxin oxidoreductase, beta subunit|nr:indolepyruvate oxidoreductase subunit beta [Candidatus Palauibacterales bacterium]
MRSIYLTGVGGHGVLTLSGILAEAALTSGFDVRKSEIHGMSQRGGSVVSQVRYGNRVRSPVILAGTADVVISLELLEGLRALPQLKPDGVLLINEQRITPAPVGRERAPYPEGVRGICENAVDTVVIVPALEMARGLGNEKAANVVMAGAFSAFAPEIPIEAWVRTIEAAFRPEHRDLNLNAFRAGQCFVEAE